MKEFFLRSVGFGRYPNKSIGDIFCLNRPYFDQILHKNQKFRHDYAEAFQKWVDKDEQRQDKNQLTVDRILFAVELMGEERIISLFQHLVEVLNERYPEHQLPVNLDFRQTIFPEKENLEIFGPQFSQILLFWTRVAVPEVYMEGSEL